MLSNPIIIDQDVLLVKLYDYPNIVRQVLLMDLNDAVELKHPINYDTDILSLSSGFLSFPSSFHNPSVRKMRQEMFDASVHVMTGIHPGKYLQLLPDRLMIRPPAQKITTGAWHRDSTQGSEQTDIVYGGWVNLDPKPQFFEYVPGTAVLQTSIPTGYTELRNDINSSVRIKPGKIEIPPGHLLFFNETLIHRILPTNKEQIRTNTASVRLFNGVRVSNSMSDPMQADRRTVLENQTVMRLKSGQIPATFGHMNWMFHLNKIEKLNSFFKPEFQKESIRNKNKPNQRTVKHVVQTFTGEHKSQYTPYNEHEIAILKPTWLSDQSEDETDQSEVETDQSEVEVVQAPPKPPVEVTVVDEGDDEVQYLELQYFDETTGEPTNKRARTE